jgi:hypothetical protein
MSNPTTPSVQTPSVSTPTKKKSWQDMSKEERSAESTLKKAEAIKKIATGEFPKGLRFKVGDHTLTLKPSGVSEKGSVSYNLAPTTLELMGGDGKVFNIRINRVSMSVLNTADDTLEVEGGGDFIG